MFQHLTAFVAGLVVKAFYHMAKEDLAGPAAVFVLDVWTTFSRNSALHFSPKAPRVLRMRCIAVSTILVTSH